MAALSDVLFAGGETSWVEARRWAESAASQNVAQGQRRLGYMQWRGLGGPIQPEQAQRNLARAAEGGVAEAAAELGMLHYTSLRDVSGALTWWRRAAAAGHVESMGNLGAVLMMTDAEAGRAEAQAWFLRAAEGGDASAMRQLAETYRDSQPPQPAEVARWHRRGAEAGDASSAFNWSMILAEGRWVAPDPAESLKWLERSAQALDPRGMYGWAQHLAAGDASVEELQRAVGWYERVLREPRAGSLAERARVALEELGPRFELPPPARLAPSGTWLDPTRTEAEARAAAQIEGAEGVEGMVELADILMLQGRRSSLVEARSWYQRAAARGHAAGFYGRAALEIRGLGGPADVRAAEANFLAAADRGHTLAMFDLGGIYFQAAPPGSGLARAHAWWRKSAEAGCLQAMDSVATMLMTGQGVAPDPQEALGWYRKAAAGGFAPAMYHLGIRLSALEGGDPSLAAEIESTYTLAAEAGHPDAMYNLGLRLLQREPTAERQERGVAWLERAANLGEPSAMFAYAVALADGVGAPRDRRAARRWLTQTVAYSGDESLIAAARTRIAGLEVLGY